MEWIKLDTTIFEDEKIQLLMAEKRGAEIVLCWVKLLCLAGKQNNMGVFSVNGKAISAEQIATVTGTERVLMKKAVELFIEYGMVVEDGGFLAIPKWEEHQEVEKQQKRKEDAYKRVQAFRERQKSETQQKRKCNADETQMKRSCNADETQMKRKSNATEEEKEEEEEENRERESGRARARTREGDEVGFAAFWKAYPKHQGEDDARHEWLKL